MDITIPSLGDIDEVEVIELCVAVGDTVAVDDPIIVIESDKASMEIPSPVAGVIESLHVALGDQVTDGHVIASVAGDSNAESPIEGPDQDQDQAETPEVVQASAAEVDAAAASAPSPAPASQSAEIEVLVPDIGDATGVVVIEVAVKAGDEIAVNDLLVVLESDKASMEIAAEQAGTVLAVAVEEDQEVEQGTLIATLKVAGSPAVAESEPEAARQSAPAPEVDAGLDVSAKQPLAPAAPASVPASVPSVPSFQEKSAPDIDATVYAGPAVRRLARELGVQLVGIKGTGNRDRITKDDVKAFVKNRMQASPSAGASAGAGLPEVAVLDYAKFGPVETIELTRIQQRGADNLHRSWVNLPHVTQHDEADISDLEEFRQSLKPEAEQKGVKVTPLAFLVKACCHALREHPRFNASLHADKRNLIVKQYINIGMAVDTPEGLVVPVIRDADKKSIWQLSAEIAELSEKARIKKLAMDDLQGGTFSISSLGALGGTGFTPIVNAPEVAILGVSKLQTKPVWEGSEFQPRKILPLSLSYDHRVINGADGGRFMLYLTSILSDIRRLAL
jgi:pyruvate dehydrogenase E2 component (dihydrolipoamide acetyltransferase)